MKQLLIIFLIGALSLAAETVIIEENFESYEVGTQMSEQEGWGILGNYTGNTTVVTGISGFSGKCMEMSRSEDGNPNDVVVMMPGADLVPADPLKELTKVSLSFVCSTENDMIALHDANGNPFFYLRCNSVNGVLFSMPGGVSFSNLYKDGHTPNTFSVTLDFNDKKAVEASLNGVTQECAVEFSGSCVMPTRLYFYVQLSTMQEGCTASYFDDILIQTVPRPAGQAIICDDSALIPLDKTEAQFTVKNGGESDIAFTVTSDDEWLAVTPDSGTFSDTQTLTLSAKEGYQDTFRRCNITIDGGLAGTKVVSVMYQGGNIIFKEDFDSMTDGTIVGQRGWTLDVGDVVITNAYECEGKCMFAYLSGGNNGCSMYLPKPWYENLIVKVSYKLYWPSISGATGVCPLQKDSGTTEKFEAGYVPDNSGEGFMLSTINKLSGGSTLAKSIRDFPIAPYDQWVPIEYTLDLQTQKLLSFGWNGAITNFVNWSLPNPSCNYFCSWGHADWDPTGPTALHAIDDLTIERVPRSQEATLIAPSYVNGGVEPFFTIEMRNGGSGSFDYTAEILDIDDALKINRPTGTISDVGTITVTPDRSQLDENYYHARVRIDAGEAGCVTSIVAFVVGNVYYFADFEEPFFHSGDITGQDDWMNDNPDWNLAYVLTTNDQQTLCVETGGGWGGYYHSLDVPRNNFVRFEMDIFVPQAIFEDPDRLTNPILHLKQNDKYNPSIELRIAPDLMDGVPILVGDAVGYEDYPLAIADYPDDWTHLSYTIDYLEGRLVEFSIGDVTEFPEYVYTRDSDVPCTSFYICVGSEVDLQVDNVKVSVVPEPAAFVILALVALLAKRRG